MEDQHDIERHALLCNQDLLVAVDDEVAALVVAALPSILHDLVFAQLGEVAELGADHDWDLANGHLVLLENLLLLPDGRLTSCRVCITVVDLQDFDGAEDLCLVGEPADPRRVWQYWFVGAVALMQARELVHGSPAKYDFVSGLLVVCTEVDPIFGDRLLSELLDDLLHRVLQESFKRENLLCNQAVLLEVAVNDLPAVILVDGVHIEVAIGSLDRHNRLLSVHNMSVRSLVT